MPSARCAVPAGSSCGPRCPPWERRDAASSCTSTAPRAAGSASWTSCGPTSSRTPGPTPWTRTCGWGSAPTCPPTRTLAPCCQPLAPYEDVAAVLQALGIRSVRLLSNNPAKVDGLQRNGVAVEDLRSLGTAAHQRNRAYLATKQARFGHHRPAGNVLQELPATPVDVGRLLGPQRPRADRPNVVVKYAQTVDGRIATRTGDAKWISGEAERRVAHAMRAGCDAVLVGARTMLQDDPQLTVRMVPGASPMRVVLDSTLRIPLTAKVLSDDAATLILCRPDADPVRRRALASAGVMVREVAAGPGGLRIPEVLRLLRSLGVASLLVEGGGRVITSMLGAGAADRVVVSMSPTIIGAGVEAVGSLGVSRVAEGIRLVNRSVYLAGDDLLLGFDVQNGAAAD